jgi:hypothetical protein
VSERPPAPPPGEGHDPAIETPRGTLAIMIIFGLLFALTWLATYVFVFLERGAPHQH